MKPTCPGQIVTKKMRLWSRWNFLRASEFAAGRKEAGKALTARGQLILRIRNSKISSSNNSGRPKLDNMAPSHRQTLLCCLHMTLPRSSMCRCATNRCNGTERHLLGGGAAVNTPKSLGLTTCLRPHMKLRSFVICFFKGQATWVAPCSSARILPPESSEGATPRPLAFVSLSLSERWHQTNSRTRMDALLLKQGKVQNCDAIRNRRNGVFPSSKHCG